MTDAADTTREGLVPSRIASNPAGTDVETIGRYRKTPSGFHIPTRTDEWVPISNFTARIVEEVVIDEGNGDDRREYEIEAMIDGKARTVRVPASEFAGLGWVSRLGARAIVAAGAGTRDQVREAIQRFSPGIRQRTVYAHTGWANRDGQDVFLSANGCIGADGLKEVEVSLSDGLERFALPAPPTGAALQEAVFASLRLVDVAPPEIMVPLLAAVYRAPLGPSAFGIFVVGPTGAGKTALAALVQQHFGPELDAEHLPCSWQSSENALEGQLHVLKDVVAVVDDFLYTGGKGNDTMTRKAERVFRGAGNQAGRSRMTADLKIIAAKPPRSTIISTGEELPRGQSLAARRFDLELSPDDVQFKTVLDRAQMDARNGLLAEAMAGYVQWLAGRLNATRGRHRPRVQQLRRDATAEGQHKRTPTILAELALGWESFLTFAVDRELITEGERKRYWDLAWGTLLRTAEAQSAAQKDADPVLRYRELLQEAVATGQAHIATPQGECPYDGESWGWRNVKIDDDNGTVHGLPQGDNIGWIEDEDLYLSPAAAYRVAERLGRAAEKSLVIQDTALRKRLRDRGFLQSTEGERQRTTVRRMIAGRRLPVLHFHRSFLLLDEPAQAARPSQEDEDEWNGAVIELDFGTVRGSVA